MGAQERDFNESDDDTSNGADKNMITFIAIGVSFFALFILLAVGTTIFRLKRSRRMWKQIDEGVEMGRVYRPADNRETPPAYPGGYDGGSYGNGSVETGFVQGQPIEGSETGAPATQKAVVKP